jgi:hypothetical protein
VECAVALVRTEEKTGGNAYRALRVVSDAALEWSGCLLFDQPS